MRNGVEKPLTDLNAKVKIADEFSAKVREALLHPSESPVRMLRLEMTIMELIQHLEASYYQQLRLNLFLQATIEDWKAMMRS